MTRTYNCQIVCEHLSVISAQYVKVVFSKAIFKTKNNSLRLAKTACDTSNKVVQHACAAKILLPC